jgi:undecaprenyl-phosphate 4-deoxy-4-formamido-L-arabinose transferase
MYKKKISFVIPCYKCENSIENVVKDIIETVNKSSKFNYEILLVNDGSPDNTLLIIGKLVKENTNIIAINLSKNYGQHSALMAGYANVSGDYIIGLDDDGEHNPKDIFKLVDELEKGYDYVCADFSHRQRSMIKRFGSKVNDIMATSLLNKPANVTFSSFYIMRRFVVDEIVKCKNPFPYIGGLIVSITKNLSTVKIDSHSRTFGESSYNIKNSLALWLNGFTAFSVKPLRVASTMGLIMAFVGFVYGFYIIIKKIMTPDLLVGYASTMAIILFVGGMLMLSMGMLGEYIGRIYISINKVPQYVIKNIVISENLVSSLRKEDIDIRRDYDES